MPLFFSRRTFNSQNNKFTRNVAARTRYVDVPGATPARKSHIIDQRTWLDRVGAASGNGQVVVFVHGFNIGQRDMRRRLNALDKGLSDNGFGGSVVAYDWASDDSVFRYKADYQDAKDSALHLARDGIVPLIRAGLKPHLIAHSMGCLLTLRAFGSLGDPPGAVPWGVDQAIFMAADLHTRDIENGTWGAMAAERRCARLTNYFNGLDKVLDFSGVIVNGLRERVGERGLPAGLPAMFDDVDCEPFYRPRKNSFGGGTNESHAFYFRADRVHQDLNLTLQGAASGAGRATRGNAGGKVVLT